VEKGASLHQKLLRVARRVTGVDADKDALECLGQQGIRNLICADVQMPQALDIPEIPRPNPGLCLANIARLMNNGNTILLITVPNAFSFRNFFSVLSRNKEKVRADHNYYFSYTTLKSLLATYGFSIDDVYTYSNLRDGQNPLKKIVKRIVNNTIIRHSPFIAEGLIVVAGR
jgi:hypothetical protein